MRAFWRDLLHGARQLRRSPGFALVVVLTVGLGLGATTAVFSLADYLLLRPLPGVAEPDALHAVELRSAEDRTVGLSSLNLMDIAAETRAFESVGAWGVQLMHVNDPERGPVQVFGEAVGGDYFGMLGLRPRLGRGITPEETWAGSRARVAVISSDLWRTLYDGARDVVGREIQINRQPFTIVGVAPAGYRGAERAGRIDVWAPASALALLRHNPDPAALDGRRSTLYSTWAGRLAPGATPETAIAELETIVARLGAAYPEENASFVDARVALLPGIGLSRTGRENAEAAIRILGWVVVLVLAIACANAANMLLFRGLQRQGEAAVRRALGASGLRLARQQLAEGIVLAVVAAGVAALVAYGFTHLFEGTRLQMVELRDVPLDARVLGFTVLTALATGLLFGLAPTAFSRRLDLPRALSAAGRRATHGRSYARAGITVVQLSLSVTVLVGALLLTRTLLNLYAVDLGFDRSITSFTIDMLPQGYSVEQRRAFERTLFERLQTAPEFERAALTVTTPLAGFYGIARVQHPDDAENVLTVTGEWVSPGYFETLNTRIVRGRALDERDVGATGLRNVVISEQLERQLFGAPAGLGRVIRTAGNAPADLLVVGVAEDRRVRSLVNDPEPVLYEAYDAPSRGAQYITVLLRSSLSVPEAEAVLRRIVSGIDPGLPFMYGERMADKVARSIAEQRLFARLLIALSVIALVISAVGLYAIVSYSVAARTREIGVRMALGAERRHVLRLVFRSAGALAATGVVLGLAGAVWLSRILASRLFRVEPLDPPVFVMAAALFLLVMAVAAVVPTRAATRVDPLVALQSD